MATGASPNEPDVGHDEPQTPVHSLPSYDEPTAETHRRLTREEEAELALGRTTFGRGVRTFLISALVLTIVAVPVVQFVSERRSASREAPTVAAELAKLWPQRAARARGDFLPHADAIKAVEKTIERTSVVSQWLLPRVQTVLTGWLGAGNEQVYLGKDGWLFYRPDVEYVTGTPFLDPERMRHRSRDGAQPDSIRAISEFRDQLAARGIELVIVPAPSKASVDGEKLSPHVSVSAAPQNSSFAEWQRRLASAGVKVIDPLPILLERKRAGNGRAQYLATDSHWRPDAMERVADEVATIVSRGSLGANTRREKTQEVSGRGDLFTMLKLPENQTRWPAETVTLHPAADRDGGPWRANKDADVLLLGDSFTNVFSLGALGWGESAGFAEQLSLALGGQPLDCILRNSDGAFATREILAHELSRGRDRLAGKRLVIWEFAARELAIGDWKLLPLKLEQPTPARFFAPSAGQEIEVSGIVGAVSSVPQPNSVPYRDHVMSVHLLDVNGLTSGPPENAQALVYLWSMRDNVWTPAARLRPGDQVKLRLRAWADVSTQYEKFNRSEIDDSTVQLEEPAWGESLE